MHSSTMPDCPCDTKDLDLFVRRADWSRVEETLAPAGIRCELVFSHWLGKAATTAISST